MNYSVNAYGATGDGETEDTQSIQQAIDACTEAGGGTVYVGPGLYMVGTIELKNNVELHIARGATLRGIFNGDSYRAISPEDGPMTALIFARDATNIGLSGGGTIDGQGSRYWDKLDKPRSGRPDVDEVGVIQFWYEHSKDLKRPNRILAFLRCERIDIKGITLKGSTAWTCHLIHSRDIKIRGINIDNPIHGPNTDGIDIDGSSDVLVSDCTIKTGDDAIVLKTTKKYSNGTPIRNVTVTNCRFHTGCNGLKIGTETEDDIENICFSNTSIDSPDDALPVERCITGIALETVDGGNIQNVVCSNITMKNVRTALFIRLGERMRKNSREHAGSLRGIALSNIVATGATHTSVISGIPGHPIEDLQIHNLQLETKGGGKRTPEEIGEVPEHIADYPEVFMFGEVPASALYFRHVKRLNLQSCFLRLVSPDARPLCYADDVEQMQADPGLF